MEPLEDREHEAHMLRRLHAFSTSARSLSRETGPCTVDAP